MNRLALGLALAAALLAPGCRDHAGASAAKSEPPPVVALHALRLEGRVTDAAHLLSPEQLASLTAKLERFERATHHQLVVVTAPTLNGRDVADFTGDLGNAWGIGRKHVDDGIILLVAPNEHQVRIAVGYGLEKVLTHQVCATIIGTAILPRLRKGDYPGGIAAGSDAIIARVR